VRGGPVADEAEDAGSGSWEERAAYERWGRCGGAVPGAGEPWWELRAHDELGTIERGVHGVVEWLADAFMP